MPPRPAASSTKIALSTRSLEHLRRLVHAIHSQSAAIEVATGLTGPQFWALREVARARDGLTLGELARRLALHKASAGRLADRLAAKRLITREVPPDDRRVVLVRVTAAGLRQADLPVSAPPQARLLAQLEGLPVGKLSAIEGALGRLVSLLGAEGTEPAPLFEEGHPAEPPPRRVGAKGRSAPARRARPAGGR